MGIYVTWIQVGTIGPGTSPLFKIFITYIGLGPCARAMACPWAWVLFIVTEAHCLGEAGPAGPAGPVAVQEGLLAPLPHKHNHSNDVNVECLHHL